jgi:DNA polymerase I-like protein with 3'-5' exonuclease and polymerase domains
LDKLQEVRAAKLPWFVESPDPNAYLGDNWIIVDFETKNIDKGTALNPLNDIVLATWATAKGEFYHFGGIYDQKELVEAISGASFLVAQNAKFELQWLQRMGVDISRILVYDTMLGDYVIAGNRNWDLDLDSIAARYGISAKHGLGKVWMVSGVCPSEWPSSVLLEYGSADTLNERDIFLLQRERLKELNLLPIQYTRCLICTVLADIETHGVFLDEQRVREEYTKVTARLAELELAINAATGGINPNSTKQLAEFIYDRLGFDELRGRDGKPSRTPKDGRRCDADTLAALKATTDSQKQFQALIIERQDLNKRFQDLSKMVKAVEEDGGYLYAQFNQIVTRTHRLSSGGRKHKVQFQNINRDYKRFFRARHEGWLVGESDGAQLEFRVAAHLGRDPVALNDIRQKLDVHSRTASAYLGIPVDKVTKTQRQNHKPKTFEPLYGKMGGDASTKAYLDYFHDRYKATFDVQTAWTYEVLEKKELVTEWGMRFYWPDCTLEGSARRPYIRYTTSIFNYPVQSFATAEIIPISLVYLWHRLRSLGLSMFLVNTVHDSIICELPPTEVTWWKALSYQAFTHDAYSYLRKVYGVVFTVPLGTETKTGTHWSEGEAEAWDVEPEAVSR